MPLINFDDVSSEYGARLVFSAVSFGLETKQRLGVVGANGAGKSTLLKLAAGDLQPSSGTVTRQRRLRLGILPQFDEPLQAETVLEQTILARADILEMRHRLHALEQQLAGGRPNADGDHFSSAESLLHEYGEVQARYDHLGGYSLEARAREVLGGLGFHDDDLEQNPRELSGGQRRRVQLAQLLLLDADALLLDEPTNHLDLDSIEWLEDFLRTTPQAMLVVSHDRRFLDRLTDSTLELEAGSGYLYPARYSGFVRLRQERRAAQLKEHQTQREYIRHQEAFIQRYRAGQRAREARGRQTRLDRLARIEAPPDDKEIRIRFGGPASADVPLKSQGLVAGYPGLPLLRLGSFSLAAGSRVAMVGPNGSGKTTLLRTLEGSLKPLRGSVGYGARVFRSYYDQNLGDLPQEKTLVEVLRDAHPLSEESARHHLARLLFRGDDVWKRVRELSGGELSRLALARLMLDQGNLLFLDEPTNHLDVPSQEVLQDALSGFSGTLIFVSHDRELVDALATETWWLDQPAAGGQPISVQISAGGYSNRQAGASGVLANASAAPTTPRRRGASR